MSCQEVLCCHSSLVLSNEAARLPHPEKECHMMLTLIPRTGRELNQLVRGSYNHISQVKVQPATVLALEPVAAKC